MGVGLPALRLLRATASALRSPRLRPEVEETGFPGKKKKRILKGALHHLLRGGALSFHTQSPWSSPSPPSSGDLSFCKGVLYSVERKMVERGSHGIAAPTLTSGIRAGSSKRLGWAKL